MSIDIIMDTAFIWDLDGTLLDSYEIIINSLYQIYKEKGFEIDKREIYEDAINESVSYFIKRMETTLGVPFQDLKDRYTNITHEQVLSIKAMKHAKEILEYLNSVHNKVIINKKMEITPPFNRYLF